jgi:hypothetical protein
MTAINTCAEMKAKKLPLAFNGRGRSEGDGGGFDSRCKFKARRNRVERCRRGAKGKPVWARGAGDSSTIVLKNLSYFNLWPHKKIETSKAA